MVCNIQALLPIQFVITGTTIRITTEKMKEGYNICRQIYLNIASNEHNGFLEDCLITLIDKTYRADPTRREEVLKTVSPYGLNTVA